MRANSRALALVTLTIQLRIRQFLTRFSRAYSSENKEKLQQHMESGRHKIAFYCGICHEYLAFRDMASLEQHVQVKEGSRRKGYGIKIYCASSKRNWGRDIYGGKGMKKEKENFIQEGLKKAQERN